MIWSRDFPLCYTDSYIDPCSVVNLPLITTPIIPIPSPHQSGKSLNNSSKLVFLCEYVFSLNAFNSLITLTESFVYMHHTSISKMKIISLLRKNVNIIIICDMFQSTGLHAAPAGLAPSLDWQKTQTNNLSTVRQVRPHKSIVCLRYTRKLSKKACASKCYWHGIQALIC